MDINQNIKIAVDNVVFGCEDGKLKVLMLKRTIEPYKDNWCLIGCFLKDDELLNEAVNRCLLTEANIKSEYNEQLYTFDKVDRDSRCRIISTAYLSLVNPSEYKIVCDSNASDIKWFDVSDLPENIGFDHSYIINYSIDRLRNKIIYTNIAFNLFPKEFTLKSIRLLYETILNSEIEHRNFLKTVRQKGVIEIVSKGKYKTASIIYKFNHTKYNKLVSQNKSITFYN
jgi:8-oxo-dGTP diphosphatase